MWSMGVHRNKPEVCGGHCTKYASSISFNPYSLDPELNFERWQKEMEAHSLFQPSSAHGTTSRLLGEDNESLE